jgi:hypothetical protein
MKHKIIKVPIYTPAGVIVVIDKPKLDLIKKHYPELYNQQSEAIIDLINGSYCALTFLSVPYKNKFATYVMFNTNNTETTFGTISHEALHVMNNIYRKIQVHHSYQDDEEYGAYLIGWITDEICSVIDVKKILKNTCTIKK